MMRSGCWRPTWVPWRRAPGPAAAATRRITRSWSDIIESGPRGPTGASCGMGQETSWNEIRTQFSWITPRIAQGPFASEPRGVRLRAEGMTHILNVGEAPSVLSAAPGGFREVAWHPVEDLARIPEEDALDCIGAIHRMLGESGSKVYVHCIAGQNRSPMVLWLYLVACGHDPAAAKRLIEERNLDAVAGHSRFVDEALIRRVILHGRENDWTTARAGLIDPF